MNIRLSSLENNFIQELKEIVCLDYAAIDAYESALGKLKNEKYKNILEKFKNNHKIHINNISRFLTEKGYRCPTGPGVKYYLTHGKVILATFAGDTAILKALRSSEFITNEAYDNIISYKCIPNNLKQILLEAYEDEKDHLFWIEEELDAIS